MRKLLTLEGIAGAMESVDSPPKHLFTQETIPLRIDEVTYQGCGAGDPKLPRVVLNSIMTVFLLPMELCQAQATILNRVPHRIANARLINPRGQNGDRGSVSGFNESWKRLIL